MATRLSLADVTEMDIEKLEMPLRLLRSLDETVISELAASIRSSGLLQPILVRKSGEEYEVVFGCHRLEACRRLGMRNVKARIAEMSDAEAFLARVTENLIRNNYVNPIEEAQGYKGLVNAGWTINAIAHRIGKCDSYVSERVGLLDRLDQRLLAKVSDNRGHLTPSHAELISRISDVSKQRELADFVEKKRLSVRSLEDILNGAPLPTKVQIRMVLGECSIVIPKEFVSSLQFSPGEHLHMYVRGSNLVLEKVTRSRGRGKHQSHISSRRLHSAVEYSHVRKSSSS